MKHSNQNDLPNAPACERNREPILQALLPFLCETKNLAQTDSLRHNVSASDTKRRILLEIGSGTGQHAAYFTQYLARQSDHALLNSLYWQTSDTHENLPGINRWRAATFDLEEGATSESRLLAPIELDLRNAQWAPQAYDFMFTANTLHIISWPLVLELCRGAAITLRSGGLFFVYGPFTYDGAHTSASNEQFDAMLRARDSSSGIRNFSHVAEALRSAGNASDCTISQRKDIAMPANNRLLVFQKS